MGGYCEFEEVEPFLRRIAEKMPFKAEVISQSMLDVSKFKQFLLIYYFAIFLFIL